MRNLMQAFDIYGAEAGIEPFLLLLKIKGNFQVENFSTSMCTLSLRADSVMSVATGFHQVIAMENSGAVIHAEGSFGKWIFPMVRLERSRAPHETETGRSWNLLGDKLIDILIRQDDLEDLEDLRHNKRCHRLRHICTEKAPIIQGFVVSGFWQNATAHTSAHTPDGVLLFDQRLISPMFSCLHLRP